MSIIIILILVSLGLGAGFLAAFIWAVKSGQFEDTTTPSLRILPEDLSAPTENDRIQTRVNNLSTVVNPE
jgi:cbb3-type cytochrome oxidase maturation protein